MVPRSEWHDKANRGVNDKLPERKRLPIETGVRYSWSELVFGSAVVNSRRLHLALAFDCGFPSG